MSVVRRSKSRTENLSSPSPTQPEPIILYTVVRPIDFYGFEFSAVLALGPDKTPTTFNGGAITACLFGFGEYIGV